MCLEMGNPLWGAGITKAGCANGASNGAAIFDVLLLTAKKVLFILVWPEREIKSLKL
jgi:hypothetical protein